MDTNLIIFLSGLTVLLFIYIKRHLHYRSIEQVSPGEIREQMNNDKPLVLVDVRSQRERSAQFISGSLHIPLHELAKRSEELNRYRDKQIICYCQSGARSLSAVSILKKKGFPSVANMKGGIAEWNFQRSQK